MVRWVISLFVVFLVTNAFTLANADSFSSENILSEGVSEFNYYFETTSYDEATGFQIIRGEDFELDIGIEIIKFGPDVQSFYNVFLYLRVINNEGLFVESIAYFERITSLGRSGTIWNFDSSELQYTDSQSILQYYTNFNILVGITFSESLVTSTQDPYTDDSIHFLHEVDILTESEKRNSQDAGELINEGDDRIAENHNDPLNQDPDTPVPPESPDDPNFAPILILIALVIGVVIVAQKSVNTSKSHSKLVSSKKMSKSNPISSKPGNTSISAKLCPSCGTISPDASQFCMECGVHLP